MEIERHFGKPGFFLHVIPKTKRMEWLSFEDIGDSTFRGWTKHYTGGSSRKSNQETSERDGWNSQFLVLVFQAVCCLQGRPAYQATYDDVFFTCALLRIMEF